MIDELYDLIGGKRTVWAATEAFYRRVLADDTLGPFFEKTDMAQLRARQSMFISMLLGGRIVAKGLNDGHYDRFLEHFRRALQEVGVQADKIGTVTKLLESKRRIILNPPENDSGIIP